MNLLSVALEEAIPPQECCSSHFQLTEVIFCESGLWISLCLKVCLNCFGWLSSLLTSFSPLKVGLRSSHFCINSRQVFWGYKSFFQLCYRIFIWICWSTAHTNLWACSQAACIWLHESQKKIEFFFYSTLKVNEILL